jgi:hypothetical protein
MDNRGVADKTAGVVAVVARRTPAPVDSRAIHNSSHGFDPIIGDSITIAPAVVEASKRSNYDSDNVQLSNAMP